ncbi:hypothetical protein O0I10_003195 [Lichtheimia ornata]|uniref:N-acetyltransferase domain-containing protein n=1 Tax=Lichtheimia ornata TaxID=688661 RepID=A0AAD7V9A5_9FUNG|nr:uncharacterized protein O0I10_003195 [Lichtheimia ornata]KAJ8660973.1 hypothetical protein O0I10_003195 [Lichtheimia ornata]
MSWVAVVHLVIYNLIRRQDLIDMEKPDAEKRHKYFRWKDDICAFIDDYWDYLVPGKKRSPTWHNTIASVLSTHGTIFKSGYEIFHQSAWWSLFEQVPPTKENKPRVSKAKGTQKRSRQENQEGKSKKIKAEPHDKRPTGKDVQSTVVKKEQQEASASHIKEKDSMSNEVDDIFDLGSLSDLSSDPGILSDDDAQISVKQSRKPARDQQVPQQQVERVQSMIETPPPPAVSSPSELPSTTTAAFATQTTVSMDTANVSTPYTPHDHVQVKIEPENTATPLSAIPNLNDDMVAKEDEAKPNTHASPKPQPQPTILTQQMEWQMLQQLGNASKKLPTVAARFERKLAVRRLKRNLGLRLFDMDAAVSKQLRSKSELEPMTKPTTAVDTQKENTPDTTQQQLAAALDAITYTPYKSSFASRLYGPIRHDSVVTKDEPWLSAWNGRKLRPYIRRDFQNVTPYMETLMRIRSRNSNHPQNERHSIDYVYFQPQHLEQCNAMLRRCFWDGIDVSESLLFPEFSIVALYKRLVVGCAFMTPEAYVTYFAVLPGWNNAGIGQFMLYHLFQTAISKDITLHVSANNNAMILYQKFGFKPEEFIVDFYDKYLPADSAYSKNAFFLRLRR